MLTYDTWHDHKGRPVFVRAHREELAALTSDDADRVPDSPGAVRDWVRRYDSAVSKRLQPNEEGDDGES